MLMNANGQASVLKRTACFLQRICRCAPTSRPNSRRQRLTATAVSLHLFAYQVATVVFRVLSWVTLPHPWLFVLWNTNIFSASGTFPKKDTKGRARNWGCLWHIYDSSSQFAEHTRWSKASVSVFRFKIIYCQWYVVANMVLGTLSLYFKIHF